MLLPEEKEVILNKIEKLSEQLGGDYLHQNIINTKGESAKRILITYDNDLL